MKTYKCQCCGEEFEAREADRKRGWARFCGKSCKAKKQEARTGQYRAHLARKNDDSFDVDAYHAEDPSWDAHKGYF